MTCSHPNVNSHREGTELVNTCRDCGNTWIQFRTHLTDCNLNTYGRKQVVTAMCNCGEPA